MQRYFNNVTSRSGDAIQGVSVTVRDATGALATLYSDDAGTPQSNPLLTDSTGTFSFYAADGTYTLTFSGQGIGQTTQTIMLDTGASVADYDGLRAFPGTSKTVNVTGFLVSAAPSGVAGVFTVDDDDTTSADNGGTIIVANNGKRWKRVFSGPVDVRWFGARGPGVTDDAPAFTAALAAYDYVRAPGGLDYQVSTFQVGEGKTLLGDGITSTVINQNAGQPVATPIIRVTGSYARVGRMGFRGNIATDTGEHHHCIIIQSNALYGNLDRVVVEDVHAQDIRGDVVYWGQTTGYSATNVTIHNVTFDNVLRNGVSAVGNNGGRIGSVTGTRCGFCHVDVEPNAGAGTGENLIVGYVKGRMLGLNAQTAADALDGIEVQEADLSPTYAAQSSPPYGPGAVIENGLLLRNIKRARIGQLRLSGFNGSGAFVTYNVGEIGCQMLEIGTLHMRDCSLTDVVYNSYFQGASGFTRVKIGYVDVAITQTGKRAFSGCSSSEFQSVLGDIRASSMLLRDSNDVLIGNVAQTGANGFLMQACNRVTVRGGSFTGDRLTSQCDKVSFENFTATAAVFLYDANTEEISFRNSTLNGVYYAYLAGPGGQVTQLVNKTTGVTLNTRNGQINMEAAANIAAGAVASFTLTSNKILAHDVVHVQRKSGGTAGSYRVWCDSVAAGSCVVCVENRTGGALAEAVVLQFSVINSAVI